MTSEKLLGWGKLFLLLTAFRYCRCLQVSIREPQYEVARGGNIILPCSYSPARPNFELLILKWETVRDNKATIVATFYSNLNRVDISPDYEGRTSMEVDVSKKVSVLNLAKVTMEDNGNFQCSVLIPGDDEGTTSASTSLLVLVAPSPPICRIQGKAEYWHNITLTCISEEGSPKPLYEWKSYNVENSPRPFPPKTIEKDGALSLFNISRETSGFYTCTSTNRIGSASCNFTLAVMPGGSMSGATVGIIGGVVAAVLLLAILIYCCCRKKNKKAKYVEGSPRDMEFCDRDAPDASEQYFDNKSDIDSKPQNTLHQNNKDIDEQNSSSLRTAGHKPDVDQQSNNSGQERHEDMESNANSSRYQGNKSDYRGSRDRLDDNRYKNRDNSDPLENHNLRHGSCDRLGDNRDHYRRSRDRLDDNQDHYRGSRDRLDDNRDHYRGSRDRLDDNRDHYSGSRDRLDDNRDHYRGSRDRLDDNRDHYRGSRDQLDYTERGQYD